MTDDAKALRERLETATGERVSALERIGEVAREAPGGEKMESKDAEPEAGKDAGRGEEPPESGKERMQEPEKASEPKRVERELRL